MMFWSGASFEEAQLQPGSGKFKDASITYVLVEQVDVNDLMTHVVNVRMRQQQLL